MDTTPPARAPSPANVMSAPAAVLVGPRTWRVTMASGFARLFGAKSGQVGSSVLDNGGSSTAESVDARQSDVGSNLGDGHASPDEESSHESRQDLLQAVFDEYCSQT